MGTRSKHRDRLRKLRQQARYDALTPEMRALGEDACRAWVIHGRKMSHFLEIARSHAGRQTPQQVEGAKRLRTRAAYVATKIKGFRDKLKRRAMSKRVARQRRVA